jgi:hypothetical protein
VSSNQLDELLLTTINRALKTSFEGLENDDEPSVNETRGTACEYIAWRLVLQLSEWESIDCLLDEIQYEPRQQIRESPNEASPLLQAVSGISESEGLRIEQPDPRTPQRNSGGLTLEEGLPSIETQLVPSTHTEAFAANFARLNALEIAAVVGAKKFLSQLVVQRLVERIWRGDIVFWERLDIHAVKEAHVYNPRYALQCSMDCSLTFATSTC